MGRRRWIKGAAALFATLLAYAGFHVLLTLYPRPLFTHRVEHGNFTVYMRETIPEEIHRILDRVEARLATSTLNDPRRARDVYIFNSRRLVRYLMLRDPHFGANLPNGATWVVDADVERDVARCAPLGPHDRRRRTLTETIVHEIAHALIREHLGRRRERRLPSWLREGYCEYVAQGAAIDDDIGLSVLEGRGASTPGFPQFRNRLLVEYLINVRGMSIEAASREPPPPAEVEAAVLRGLREEGSAFLDRLRSRR